jgi:hypothetical protein
MGVMRPVSDGEGRDRKLICNFQGKWCPLMAESLIKIVILGK